MSRVVVVKVGGNEIDDAGWLERLTAAIAEARDRVVLVHGGGKEVSELQRALGAEPEWKDGLRVTTPQALRAVSKVLSGLVNKRIVAMLVSRGLEAVGLSGEDAGMFRAEFAQEGRLGRTGEIREVRTHLLRTLLDHGMVPVISPVSRGPDGGALNVNADDAACAVAVALQADRLLLVSNIPGVLRDGEPVKEISGEIEMLIAAGIASGGMAPKLRAAARAAAGGVRDVRIGGLALLHGEDGGTRVLAGDPTAVAG